MTLLEKQREYNRKSYWKHKTSRDAKIKAYHKQVKIDVIKHYSNGTNKCNYCGIKGLVFLTIDHIDGDGAKQRRLKNHKTGIMFYIWLRKNKYPKGFQVLCYNCNQAKKQLFQCPHQNSEFLKVAEDNQ